MTRQTYGQALQGHIQTMDDDVIEYRRQMESRVIEDIHRTADNAKNSTEYKNKDFYVVLLMKVERIGAVPRTLVLARHSCPTPVYKQSVWKYKNASDTLEFLWSIPDSVLYYHILKNTQKYLNDKECAQLAKFVILMESGELTEWVKKENGEKKDALIKINKEEN